MDNREKMKGCTKLSMERVFLLLISLPFVLLALYELFGWASKAISPLIPTPHVNFDEVALEPGAFRSMEGLILDGEKKPIGFDIGRFKDISGFSEVAQKDFHRSIQYFIYPSANCDRIEAIRIPVTKSSKIYGFSKETLEDKDYDAKGYNAYGPILFRRGETWKIWGTSPTENKHTGGWQPLCYEEHVTLTPEATEEAARLLKLLRDLKDLRLTENGFEKRNDVLLTKEELELAIKYGIIETERKWLFFNEPTGISSKYKVVQKYLHSKERKFSNTPTYETLKGITLGVNKELFAKQLQTNEIVENIKAEQITDNASVVSGIEFSELDGKVGGFEWNFDNDILTSITFSFWEETEYERNANVKQIISSYLDSKYIKVSETSYKNQCMSVDI